MKIKKIEFVGHPVFGDHIVIFGEEEVPTISFLVGNNGSGKTKILDAIYQALGESRPGQQNANMAITLEFSNAEMEEFGISEDVAVYHLTNARGIGRGSLTDESGNSIQANIREMSKVIYSSIEVNFESPEINTVTTRNIDQAHKPKSKSAGLNTEIPQLLVDIKHLDDSERSKWYEENRGKRMKVPSNIGGRLERFTNAFHKIYGGSKTFSSIKNEENAKRIVFLDSHEQEVKLNDLSTGEKQIIYRIGYILKELGNMHSGIVLIDEPELGLHPTWQMKLKDFLLELFDGMEIQIILATHSPFIFQNLKEDDEVCIKIDREKDISSKISLIFQNVPYTPSIYLINYIAYGIVSELLHIELYTLLQIREQRTHIRNSPGKQDGIEDWLLSQGLAIRKTFTRRGQRTPTHETLMTWIRNKIHHPDEKTRPQFTASDLEESILELIQILKTT